MAGIRESQQKKRSEIMMELAVGLLWATICISLSFVVGGYLYMVETDKRIAKEEKEGKKVEAPGAYHLAHYLGSVFLVLFFISTVIATLFQLFTLLSDIAKSL